MIDVAPVVERRARQLGDRGREWLARLPVLIADVEREWSIRVGPRLPGGSAAYVARARTKDGGDAVLKLAIPEPEVAGQIAVLDAARGLGYARLLAHDLARHALLLESLGPSLDRLGLPPERVIETLCAALRQAWRVERWPALPVNAADRKARQLAELVSRLWEQLGRPCSERVIERALQYADRRAAAFDPDRCVVVHGDPHAGNALQAPTARAGAESGFVFVDPDGFLADPAYDLGVVLRDWCDELLAGDAPALAGRYCRLLSTCSGVDETAIWEWGFLERVSTGLFVMQFGAVAAGRRFLATAERLV